MTTLLAVTGLSPAIVTETLWALAQERPRVLPGRVVFVTTGVGAGELRKQLFSPQTEFGGRTVWQALREAVQAGENELIAEQPRIIGAVDKKSGTLQPLDDIVTPQDNDIAAGFILEQVRGVVENPDTRLIASIAGGRKTMGALLHAAVSLIGRETDRLTHVLVSPPFETLRGFFFPGQPGGPVADREGKRFDPKAARVQLADVPFVPLRNRFADLREMPGSFSGLVRRCSQQMKADAARPVRIEISYRKRCLWVDEKPVKMRPKALALLHFLAWMTKKGLPLTSSQNELAKGMNQWLAKQKAIPLGLRPAPFEDDSFRHELSHLRVTMRKAGAAWTIPDRSLELAPFSFHLREDEPGRSAT
jgi:CRISPR-associated protein (TIGR02584 family)